MRRWNSQLQRLDQAAELCQEVSVLNPSETKAYKVEYVSQQILPPPINAISGRSNLKHARLKSIPSKETKFKGTSTIMNIALKNLLIHKKVKSQLREKGNRGLESQLPRKNTNLRGLGNFILKIEVEKPKQRLNPYENLRLAPMIASQRDHATL